MLLASHLLPKTLSIRSNKKRTRGQEAAGLAAKIKEACGIEAELIKGENGIFDIAVNGILIYSKQETGVFPDDREIIKLINEI